MDEVGDQLECALLQHRDRLTRADFGHSPVDLPELDPINRVVKEHLAGRIWKQPILLRDKTIRRFATVAGRDRLCHSPTRVGQLEPGRIESTNFLVCDVRSIVRADAL